MTITHKEVLFYRCCLALCIVVILFFATAPLENTVIIHVWDKLQHFAAFIVLAFFLDHSFPLQPFNRFKLLTLVVFGVFIELIQSQIPYRFFSLLDVAADSIGAIFYIPLLLISKRLGFYPKSY